MSRLIFSISLGKAKFCRAGRATECRGVPVNIWFYYSAEKSGIRICCFEIVNQAHLLHHFDNYFLTDKNLTCSYQSPSRSREVILQDLPRFLQKRVILQDLARCRLSCKILQDGGYLARILKEGGYLARILQESCKITIPKFLSKNTKQITEIRCKIKKIVSRTRIQNFFELISKI